MTKFYVYIYKDKKKHQYPFKQYIVDKDNNLNLPIENNNDILQLFRENEIVYDDDDDDDDDNKYNIESNKESIIGLKLRILENKKKMKLYFIFNEKINSKNFFVKHRIIEKQYLVNGKDNLLFFDKLKEFINDNEFTNLLVNYLIEKNILEKAGKKRKTHKRKHNKKRRKTTKKR